MPIKIEKAYYRQKTKNGGYHMQIAISHEKDNDNGFTIDGTFFRTFRCLGTTVELLKFCKDAVNGEETEYLGETEEEDLTGDSFEATAGRITATINSEVRSYDASAFAKAVALAVASDPDVWTVHGYDALNEEGIAEVHRSNKTTYTILGDLVTELGSIK